MAKFQVFTILFLLLVLTRYNRAFDISMNDALELIRLGHDSVMDILETWDMIRPAASGTTGGAEDFVFVKRMEKKLRERIDRVSKKIDDYQERMEIKADNILSQLLIQLPMQRRLDDSLRELDHYIGQVDGLYSVFDTFANDPNKYERYTIEQFAKSCVSPNLGALPDVLKSIHRLIVPSEQQVYNRSVLVLLAQQMKVGLIIDL